MRLQNATKVTQLQGLPEGQVVSTAWLGERGYSRQLLSKYVGSGWLERVGRSAYRRPGPPLKWQHVVFSLQAMRLAIYPGGETALSLWGRAHQLPLSGQTVVHLYGAGRLPAWVASSVRNVEFRHHRDPLFDQDTPHWTEPARKKGPAGSWEPLVWGPWDWTIHTASSERAWLEVLQGVPTQTGFDEAEELASGLRSLRPKVMESLLQRCLNLKVRRLALWFGERHQHAWVTKIDRGALDLGSGKRSLSPGGRLVKAYGITVPTHLADDV